MNFLTKIYTVVGFSPLGDRKTNIPGEYLGEPERTLTFAEVEIECRQYGVVTRAWYDVFSPGGYSGHWRFSETGKVLSHLPGIGDSDVDDARVAYHARSLYRGAKAPA